MEPTNASNSPSDSSSRSFRIEEFKALKMEIAAAEAEMALLERGAVVAVGAVYSWLTTHPTAIAGAWLIPMMFPLLGGLRAYALGNSVSVIGDYIFIVERSLEKRIGWEHYLKGAKRGGTFRAAAMFWFVLTVLTTVVAISKG